MTPYWQMTLVRFVMLMILIPAFFYTFHLYDKFLDKRDIRYDVSFVGDDPLANATYAGLRFGFGFTGVAIIFAKCLELLFL